MVFGEIVEPTSRALWDDDYDEYVSVEENDSELEWQDFVEVPQKVDKLFIGESTSVISLFRKLLLNSKKPICKLVKAETCIYDVGNNSYIITYTSHQDVIVGKVTEKLTPWLKAAKNVYVLTSLPLALYQSTTGSSESASCLIRCLSTKRTLAHYPLLEVPNLVTGLSASVFSYCMHINLNCTLFIGFFDGTPLDSINTQPFIDLFKSLGITFTKTCVLDEKGPSNNLYL